MKALRSIIKSHLARLGRLVRDESGATTLEWSLLLAAIALPGYYVIRLALETLVLHYQMMTMINSLPFL